MKFHLVADQLAVDLANTEVLEDGKPVDLLADYEDLLDWLSLSGALDPEEAPILRRRFRPDAAILLREAKRLRRAAHVAIEAMKSRAPLPDFVLRETNALLRHSEISQELRRTPTGVELVRRRRFPVPESLLAPVAESLAELVATGDPALLRKCESPDCILHIYDTTKNHRRRWCSMAACGNRAKVAAFRDRARTVNS